MVIWKDLPHTEQIRIASLPEKGEEFLSIAAYFKIKPDSLRRYGNYLKQPRNNGDINPALLSPYIFPEPKETRYYTGYETITAEEAIVIADIEFPDFNRGFLLRVLYTAMANNIKLLIIAGDLVASDMPPLSTHKTPYKWEGIKKQAFSEVCTMTNDMLATLGLWFEQIIILEGNHDIRVASYTDGEVHLGMLLGGDNVVYSRYPYCYLETSHGPIKIIHPDNYSRIPSRQGQTLCASDPRTPHIVMAHTHLYASALSLHGISQIECIGTGRASEKTEYASLSVTTHPCWNDTFAMIEGGIIESKGAIITNWPKELGDLYPDYKRALTPKPHLRIVKPATNGKPAAKSAPVVPDLEDEELYYPDYLYPPAVF